MSDRNLFGDFLDCMAAGSFDEVTPETASRAGAQPRRARGEDGMIPDRCHACADLTAPCAACLARDVARLCDEMQPAFDACRVADEVAEALRPKPVAVTAAGTG